PAFAACNCYIHLKQTPDTFWAVRSDSSKVPEESLRVKPEFIVLLPFPPPIPRYASGSLPPSPLNIPLGLEEPLFPVAVTALRHKARHKAQRNRTGHKELHRVRHKKTRVRPIACRVLHGNH